MTDQPSAPTTPSLPRTVAVGSDHAGFGLKEEIAKHLVERGIEVVDMGHAQDEPGRLEAQVVEKARRGAHYFVRDAAMHHDAPGWPLRTPSAG